MFSSQQKNHPALLSQCVSGTEWIKEQISKETQGEDALSSRLGFQINVRMFDGFVFSD